MLKNAFIFCNGNENVINNEFVASLNTDKDYYKYLFYADNEFYKLIDSLYEDDSLEIQYVSVGEYGELLGYFSGTISHETKKIDEILICKFISNNTPENQIIFKTDLYNFFNMLLNKSDINFVILTTSSCNHRMKKILNNLCILHNGRVVGTEYGTVVKDNVLSDKLIYQFYTKDFLEKYNSKMIKLNESNIETIME